MSIIYFHSLDGEVEVHGAERIHFDHLIHRMALAVLNPGIFREKIQKSMRDTPSFLANSKDDEFFDKYFRNFFHTSTNDDWGYFIINGERIDLMALAANTALVLGSDAVKMAARIHAQCEIHGYFEGKNRKWAADIVRKGRQAGIFRANMGWEEVIDLLEKGDK